MNSKQLPKCPVDTTLSLLNSRWKILIINSLLDGTKRFVQLKKSAAGITPKVLTSNLREMEKSGLVERKIYPQTPPKVEYTLTDVGYSLRPVIDALKIWGKDYKKYTKLVEKMQAG